MIASSRLYNQVDRLLFELSAIANHRFGMSFEWIADIVQERFGVCERTVFRDVQFLRSVSFITHEVSTFGIPIYKLDRTHQFSKFLPETVRADEVSESYSNIT